MSQSQNLSSKVLAKRQIQPHEQYLLGIQHGSFEPEAGVWILVFSLVPQTLSLCEKGTPGPLPLPAQAPACPSHIPPSDKWKGEEGQMQYLD